MIKKIFYIAILLSTTSGIAVAPYYSIRSQSFNVARELVGAGWNSQINLCNREEWNGNFSITAEYTRSLKPQDICECLFGCCVTCCNSCSPCFSSCNPYSFSYSTSYRSYYSPLCTSCCMPCCCNSCCDDKSCFISISGSQVPNRGACDWLADYFGLPTDYKSFVVFQPQIDNFIVDFHFYLGLDEWVKGLYFKIKAPLVRTNWDLNMCEYIQDDGENNHWPGYFNGTLEGTEPAFFGIQRLHLVSSFTEFITGCGTITADDIRFNPLCYAKITGCNQTKTALADLRAALGWNFLCKDSYHVGLNIQGAAPTGNRPEAYYFFEPIAGNGHHWEIGGGLSAHWAWKNKEETNSFGIYVDANISHLMGTKQIRTFDLCGKPFSRYMLAAEFASPVDDLQAGPADGQLAQPNKQFKGVYLPVANITTFSVDVSVGAQADIVIMLQTALSNFSCDIGYNFWGKSCEKIEQRCDCPCQFDENRWALKGDAFMYGFKADVDGSITTTAVPLSATQSKSTIYNGTNNWPNGLDNLAWPQNPCIDARELAWDGSNPPLSLLIYDVANTTTHQIYTSHNPVFIKFCAIDFNGAGIKGISHKLFAHLDYTWKDREHWFPYLGIGGEVELGSTDCSRSLCNSGCCTPCCTPCECTCCNYCALSQWGVWLKGGVAFN